MARFFALLFLGCWLGTLWVGGMILRDYEARIMAQHLTVVTERARNQVLNRALDLLVKNKFKKDAAIWAAVQEAHRAP